jgi:predicted ATP-binding protein involved in virulence
MITGPNGYGKTTILTIINALSRKNLFYFYQLPFDKITIRLDNKQSLSISSVQSKNEETTNVDRELSTKRQIEFKWYQEDSMLCELSLEEKAIREAARTIGFYIGYNDDFRDLMSDSSTQFISNNTQIYNTIAKEQKQELFLMLLSSISSTFIEAQRLLPSNELDNTDDKISSIEFVQKKLKQRMSNDYFRYLKNCQQKDSKFIDTLLSSEVKYTEDEYNRKITDLSYKMEELNLFGLINIGQIKEYNKEKSAILSAYIEDLEDKMKVYTQSVEKLRLFSILLSKKEFSHKKISFSPEYGFRIVSDSDVFIDINKLSSGEQNEIIMLYNFIFEVADNSLLLIDEPEISLHVVWQQEFIQDIEEIAKLKRGQVIVATHSPQIIGGRWKEAFDLFKNNIEK